MEWITSFNFVCKDYLWNKTMILKDNNWWMVKYNARITTTLRNGWTMYAIQFYIMHTCNTCDQYQHQQRFKLKLVRINSNKLKNKIIETYNQVTDAHKHTHTRITTHTNPYAHSLIHPHTNTSPHTPIKIIISFKISNQSSTLSITLIVFPFWYTNNYLTLYLLLNQIFI